MNIRVPVPAFKRSKSRNVNKVADLMLGCLALRETLTMRMAAASVAYGKLKGSQLGELQEILRSSIGVSAVNNQPRPKEVPHE